MMEALDQAIRADTVPEGAMLYRGIARVPRLDIGEVMTDLAFQSFSRSPLVSARFANFGLPVLDGQPVFPDAGIANVLWRFLVPAGQRGLSLGNDEAEVILPRAQSFRVIGQQEIRFRDPRNERMRWLMIYDMDRADET